MYEHGAAANIFAPPLLLVFGFLSAAQRGVWFVSLLLIVAYQKSTTAAAKSKGKKLQPYLHICLPMYFASLTLGVAAERPLRAVALVLLLIVAKVGCCMSVCLHRYAGHGAFKCGPTTNALLCVLGCLANQGGPIWWASKHRAHHKFCDKPRDPHCPKLRGMIGAFAWFEDEHKYIDLEFSPLHLRGRLLMLIDTCARLGFG